MKRKEKKDSSRLEICAHAHAYAYRTEKRMLANTRVDTTNKRLQTELFAN